MSKYELMADIIVGTVEWGVLGTVTIDGEWCTNKETKALAIKLGMLNDKNEMWIKKGTVIKDCDLTGGGGGCCRITFDIDGHRIDSDLMMDYKYNEETDTYELY